MSDSNLPVIVLDNGSGYLKGGLSTSSEPDFTIPALVGRPMLRYAENIEEVELKELMIGDEVTPVRSLLELSHPIKEGIIQNTEDMAYLWDYAINTKLGINTDDYKDRRVLLTEAPNNPTANRVAMAEILFESLNVGSFNIEPQAKLSLFTEGSETGLVFDSGDGVSHCIPIFSSNILHHNIKRLNVAGRHITEYLIRLLQRK